MIDNLTSYFEILDLSKGNDFNENIDEENFLLGKVNSWEVFKLNYDIMPIERSKYDSLKEFLKKSLGSVEAESKMFTILHKPGYGGTILSKRIAWDMHYNYPVLLLEEYEIASTIQILQDFYSVCKRGILIIVDENNISKSQMENFTKDIRNAKFPTAILTVNRMSNIRTKEYLPEHTIYLQHLYKTSKEELVQKCRNLAAKKFDEALVINREALLNEVEELKRLKLTEDSVNLVDNNILFEIIENIDSLKKTSTFNNSVYEIDRHRFDALIKRLTEELR